MPPIELPAGVDAFTLKLPQIRLYSSEKNFELVGHSYLLVDQRSTWAKAQGRPGAATGSGLDTVQVFDGIAYLGGHSTPPTLFHVLIADVRDPERIALVGSIPCRPGTHCGTLAVDPQRKLLVVGHDTAPQANPPPAGAAIEAGWAIYDVADPKQPRELAFVALPTGGETHAAAIAGGTLYACGTVDAETAGSGLSVIDIGDPTSPRRVGEWHVPGQRRGEEFSPLNRNGPDGKPQKIGCQSVAQHADRLYLGWGDAGAIVLDVTDRTAPKPLAIYDFVPPFHGGAAGAAHFAVPVVTPRSRHPDLVVETDAIFDCPPGFGRIFDVSDLRNPEVVAGRRPANVQPISSFRLPFRSDVFEEERGDFFCSGGGNTGGAVLNSAFQPLLDWRSSSLLYVTWFDEGVRALDISNPFAPRFTGYFLSPRFEAPGRSDRQTRGIFQDPATDLIYVTDGNGGGLFVLRFTGPIPAGRPVPAAR